MIRLHINTGTRITTVSLNETLYQLMSVKLTGELNQRSEVSRYLSKRLQDKHGCHYGKRSSVNIGISGWITDIIISDICGGELLAAYDKLL